jgi:GTP-binding protein
MTAAPLLVLVGRPNVGKSTLFNRLTNTRAALVSQWAGLTRDRQYGAGTIGDQPYWVVDTGGIEGASYTDTHDVLTAGLVDQVNAALQQASAILMLVDAQAGLTPIDLNVVAELRRLNKPIFLIINKTDGIDIGTSISEFAALGLPCFAISAAKSRGLLQMMTAILNASVPPAADDASLQTLRGTRITLMGRPNVGKSTLANRLLGESRLLVSDQPGTTRDALAIPLHHHGRDYVLVDTAGIRRRARVEETVEKFSVVKSLEALKQTDVVLLLMDAHEPLVDQDVHLLGLVLQSGKACVLVMNKWDGLSLDDKKAIKEKLHRKLEFVDHLDTLFISAKHGTGVGHLYDAIDIANRSATLELTTPQLNTVLQRLVERHPPPMVQGRRIKLRYIHQKHQRPPTLLIHGNQTEHLTDAYKRYLAKQFHQAFKIRGVPVVLEFKTGENPYAHKRNKLTPRQEYKRKRMMRFIKK